MNNKHKKTQNDSKGHKCAPNINKAVSKRKFASETVRGYENCIQTFS
jgi:hypothetical protein